MPGVCRFLPKATGAERISSAQVLASARDLTQEPAHQLLRFGTQEGLGQPAGDPMARLPQAHRLGGASNSSASAALG